MIKIVAGVYGHKENGIILPKDKDSEPFSLEPEREAELVAQGVAEYANVIIPESESDNQQPDEDPAADSQTESEGADEEIKDSEPDEDPEDETDGSGPDEDPDGEPADEKSAKPEYSEKMKLTELQELASTLNLDAQNMRTKAEVIKLLDDYFAEDDTEEPPAFGAMDPVE